ncbi:MULTISPECIES: hypothetical protein [Sphingomonas]|uniref:hypothetical protein n=1 Tax=Sphingomonas TaxID=13687 RepID=UPI000AC7DC28|nr:MULTISPECIES: hypothetical protein [Sphingomonas]MBY0302507.1 hypothetical protein [Sphingomonas ginsenosidimutans]
MAGYRRRIQMPTGLIILSAESGCVVAFAQRTQNDQTMIAQKPATSIGTAMQEPDGTIVLSLRATGAAGASGDAVVRYPPNDPNYAAVKKHIGSIPENGSVEVKPFP